MKMLMLVFAAAFVAILYAPHATADPPQDRFFLQQVVGVGVQPTARIIEYAHQVCDLIEQQHYSKTEATVAMQHTGVVGQDYRASQFVNAAVWAYCPVVSW